MHGGAPSPQEHLGLPYVETYGEGDVPSLHTYVDFVTCLGGDGLILHARFVGWGWGWGSLRAACWVGGWASSWSGQS